MYRWREWTTTGGRRSPNDARPSGVMAAGGVKGGLNGGGPADASRLGLGEHYDLARLLKATRPTRRALSANGTAVSR
jgi:hypothetical protein